MRVLEGLDGVARGRHPSRVLSVVAPCDCRTTRPADRLTGGKAWSEQQVPRSPLATPQPRELADLTGRQLAPQAFPRF